MNEIQILYAENDLDFARTTKIKLDNSGFHVKIVRNISKALESFHSERPDLLLLNLNLETPKDGLQLIETVKNTHPWFPIIIHSSFLDTTTIIATTNMGVIDHIRKDCKTEVMVAKLRNIAQHFYHNKEGRIPIYEITERTVFNKNNGTITILGNTLKLTGNNAKLLELFCTHLNEWVSPQELSIGLWGIEKEISNLKRYAGNIRKLLASDPSVTLENKSGGYYMLQAH